MYNIVFQSLIIDIFNCLFNYLKIMTCLSLEAASNEVFFRSAKVRYFYFLY